MPAAESLSIANKRVSHILEKYTQEKTLTIIDKKLFETAEEQALLESIQQKKQTLHTLSKTAEYEKILAELGQLRETVDNFFEKVLVISDDQARSENRLLMLAELRELFLQVADIALLQ